jgi:L-fuconolactonase
MDGERRMRVVDSHVHFWDPRALHYPWLAGVSSLERTFLPGDYDDDVSAIVFVEANCAPGESTREVVFIERLAVADPRIAAIVAYVDLLDEARREAALDELQSVPRVVGIRHNIQGTPSATCLDARFVRGVQEVGARGWSFDLCATADQLDDVASLTEQCPRTQFVLDHCGKPAIRRGGFDDWARALERFERLANVSCKLSGLLTEADERQRDASSLRPYFHHVADCFGADRLLYGSDWPVLTLAGGLPLWRSIVEELTSDWTDDDRRRLFGDNAVRFYRLNDSV